jgi:hypothetical protein
MRRLLYFALALVFLALTGLVFVRVTTSPAFASRSLKARIHKGMTQEEVHRLFGREPNDTIHELGWPGQVGNYRSAVIEHWRFSGDYVVSVVYAPGAETVDNATFHKLSQKTMFDRMLESLGYPVSPDPLNPDLCIWD